MVEPSIEKELLELLAQMPPASQQAVLEHARKIAAEPTPEQRQAAWQAFLNSDREPLIDDEFEIAVEECRYMPTPFWHPHESIY